VSAAEFKFDRHLSPTFLAALERLVAGALGAAMLTTFMGRGWFKPVRPHRALEMTALGRQAFAHLGIDPPLAVASKGEKRQ
jgi:hypothetical protein